MPLLHFTISVLLKFGISLGPAASPRVCSYLFYHTEEDDIKELEKQIGNAASCTLQEISINLIFLRGIERLIFVRLLFDEN